MSLSMEPPVTKAAVPVPSQAVGRIIGKNGANIIRMRNSPGITLCQLKTIGLNSKELHLHGSSAAVAEALTDCKYKIATANKQLANNSRKIHSWTVSKNGHHLFTPREVHSTGDKPPHPHATGVGKNHHAARKQGKKFEREKAIARQLREDAARNENMMMFG